MQIKSAIYRIKGMRRDESHSTFNPEYSWNNKNIRLTARDSNSSLGITNELGNSRVLFTDGNPEELYVNIVTDGYENLSDSGFTMVGSVESNYIELINIYGFIYSNNELFTNYNTVYSQSIDELNKISNTLTNLQDNTDYYFKSFCVFNKQTYYGNIVNVKTNSQPASIAVLQLFTLGLIDIDKFSYGVVISDDGGGYISEKGIIYSIINAIPDYDTDEKVLNIDNSYIFTGEVGELIEDTTYYVRGYAINEAGISYSDVSSVKTLKILPSITTNQPEVVLSSVTCGGSNINLYEADMVSKGIVVGLSSDVDIDTSEYHYESEDIDISDFEHEFIDLFNNIYYVRAYVESSRGITYDNYIQFEIDVES